MKVTYYPEEDSLRIIFRNAPIHVSEADRRGLILDFDQQGGIVGIEVKPASSFIGRLDGEPFLESVQVTIDSAVGVEK